MGPRNLYNAKPIWIVYVLVIQFTRYLHYVVTQI